MGYSWRSNGDGTAEAVECEEFAEVVYEDDGVLIVNVARSVTRDQHLENALVDALAIHDRRHGAEMAISMVAEEFGLDVRPEGPDEQRAMTLAPRPARDASST
jgi:hypothetical protein